MSNNIRLDRIGRGLAVVAAMTAIVTIASATAGNRACTNGRTGTITCGTGEDACCCRPITGGTWTCVCRKPEQCKPTPNVETCL